MRLIYIILLCIYGVQSEFITNIKTTPKINHPKIALTGDSVATTITRRFLRIYNEDDDERAYGIQSIPGIGKVSTYLYNQKLAKTLKKNDQDIDTIFSKLGLNTAGEKLLQHPNFFIWVKYVDDYNRKNGKTLSMLPTLRRQYKDEVLIKMFEAATQVERTKHIATILQTEQMRIWKESGLSLDDLFKRFKLDRELNPFNNPAINILGRYSDEFNPGKTTLLEIFEGRYSDLKLSQILEAAIQLKTTKTLATKLQAEQMEVWKGAGLSTDELFKIYKLDDGVASMLANPMLKHWIKYADEFNPGKKTTLIDTLRTHYLDSPLSQMLISARKMASTKENARILEDQLLQSWLDDMKSLDDVFVFLNLDKGANTIFDSMQLKTWLRYEDMFKFETKGNPFVKQKTLTEILMGHYNAQALEALFKSATTAYGKKMANTVRTELSAKSLV